jgi:uncharacterized membrane protein
MLKKVLRKVRARVNFLQAAETVFHEFIQISILLMEFAGACILLVSAVKSIYRIIKNQPHARLTMVQGIARALCFKLAGEVLRTTVTREWSEILILFAIIGLHAAMSILIHWEMQMEEKRLSVLAEIED